MEPKLEPGPVRQAFETWWPTFYSPENKDTYFRGISESKAQSIAWAAWSAAWISRRLEDG